MQAFIHLVLAMVESTPAHSWGEPQTPLAALGQMKTPAWSLQDDRCDGWRMERKLICSQSNHPTDLQGDFNWKPWLAAACFFSTLEPNLEERCLSKINSRWIVCFHIQFWIIWPSYLKVKNSHIFNKLKMCVFHWTIDDSFLLSYKETL